MVRWIDAMKGSWVTTFAVGGVILLLTLFLGLQYNWLRQASEAECERMQRRVDADTRNFADDFNREMQAAYFNFQTDAASWEKADWTEFNERYDYWKSKTQYPGLIRDFVFFGENPRQLLKFDAQTRSFAAVEIVSEVSVLRAKIEEDASPKAFYEDQSALVMPVYKTEKRFETVILRRMEADAAPLHPVPERLGYLVIFLDKNVIAGSLLTDLAAKYFPEGNFRVEVKNKGDAPVFETAGALASSDAKAGLLSLAPDKMMFFGERALWSKLQPEKRHAVAVDERIESRTFTRTETGPDGTSKGTFKIEVQPGPAVPGTTTKTRRSIIASTAEDSDPWTLNVQHVAGSIDAFARNEFQKSFLIGLGIYLLLVGAIVAIVLSALRSKRFAQRQIDFVSSVSHEFRTPLAVIYSASENLADGVTKDGEQVTRYGNLIKGEGKKLSSMVEQILQFAGARSGKRMYSFSSTDVASIIEAAIAECGPMLEEKGFQVERSIDKDLPKINADADALSTALQNLISNSVKYGNGSHSICVKATNGNGKIKLSVEDQGIGIAVDDLKHIFEPFYRAKDVVDAQIHGNGLGLAVVKEIAEAHGGTVRARSEAGKGSEFTMEIPQTS